MSSSNNTRDDSQHMDITIWSIPKSDWLYSLQTNTEFYTVSKTRPGADCGSDHELLIAKIRIKLKEVGKTTRPFRYDLNQIPYDYTVEVTNRLKRLDLIQCLKSYVWRCVTLNTRWWSKPSPRKRNSTGQNSFLKRPYKYLRKEEKQNTKEKRKDTPIWMQSSKE